MIDTLEIKRPPLRLVKEIFDLALENREHNWRGLKGCGPRGVYHNCNLIDGGLRISADARGFLTKIALELPKMKSSHNGMLPASDAELQNQWCLLASLVGTLCERVPDKTPAEIGRLDLAWNFHLPEWFHAAWRAARHPRIRKTLDVFQKNLVHPGCNLRATLYDKTALHKLPGPSVQRLERS